MSEKAKNMTILDLILAALCAFRLTQLLVWDAILDPLTSWLASRSPFLDKLLACAHCTGFWCSWLTVVLLYGARHWQPLEPVVWAFALAGAVSIVQHATGWLDLESTDE